MIYYKTCSFLDLVKSVCKVFPKEVNKNLQDVSDNASFIGRLYQKMYYMFKGGPAIFLGFRITTCSFSFTFAATDLKVVYTTFCFYCVFRFSVSYTGNLKLMVNGFL